MVETVSACSLPAYAASSPRRVYGDGSRRSCRLRANALRLQRFRLRETLARRKTFSALAASAPPYLPAASSLAPYFPSHPACNYRTPPTLPLRPLAGAQPRARPSQRPRDPCAPRPAFSPPSSPPRANGSRRGAPLCRVARSSPAACPTAIGPASPCPAPLQLRASARCCAAVVQPALSLPPMLARLLGSGASAYFAGVVSHALVLQAAP
jgi:hypothetical protein